MGLGENRYGGVNNAIRLARQLSKENLVPAPAHFNRIERGPCPE